MKFKRLLCALLLGTVLFSAGCGSGGKSAVQTTEETPTPTPKKEGEIVDMQKTEKPLEAEKDYDNVIGTRTSTSTLLLITNQTGGEIATIYIRPTNKNAMTDDWGDELVKGSFTLKNGDVAAFYYEKDKKDAAGELITKYDIRVGYTDIYKNECFFRELPLTVMTELRLCMDGTGQSAIPYARYKTASSTTDYSTLEDVKKRIGLTGIKILSPTPTPLATPTPVAAATDTPTPEPLPTEVPVYQPTQDQGAAAASAYIGQSLDSLMAALGSPSGSEYLDEPETGRTGYHYYSTFTVSTIVDSAGNEIVAGVW